MTAAVRDALGWRWERLRRCAYLTGRFRNGPALASGYRLGRACGRAVTWDGTVFRHPPGRFGLPQTILEIWFDEVYTGRFYRPAAGDVVIDAGANVGLFSVWLAHWHPGVRVLAFEPFAENFALLTENIRSAGVSNVTPHAAGLGGETGRGRMEAVGARSLDHRMVAAAEGTPVYSFADALQLAAADRVALFKIDIEGSEYPLFERAADADLARVDRFAIEYHEHLRPGVLDLLKTRLAPTHTLAVHPGGGGAYGMLYATRTRS